MIKIKNKRYVIQLHELANGQDHIDFRIEHPRKGIMSFIINDESEGRKALIFGRMPKDKGIMSIKVDHKGYDVEKMMGWKSHSIGGTKKGAGRIVTLQRGKIDWKILGLRMQFILKPSPIGGRRNKDMVAHKLVVMDNVEGKGQENRWVIESVKKQ